jgi:hypothetical protein
MGNAIKRLQIASLCSYTSYPIYFIDGTTHADRKAHYARKTATSTYIMSTAEGSVSYKDSDQIIALFTIDGQTFTYTVRLNPSVMSFPSKTATLTYSDVGALTGAHLLDGYVSAEKFELNLSKGPTIKGDHKPPGVPPAAHLSGSGQ